MVTKDTLQDNEGLIEEALRDAKLVEIPSELRDNPVIHRGDETLDVPMTVSELKGAGYVYVWDSRTYERAPVLFYMLQSVLRRQRPDGSYIWTTKDPQKLPQRGTLKCYLHPDHPDRKEYNEMGLRTCLKSNITNVYEVKQHMSKKHPKEWQAIEDKRKEKERQEDRVFQRAIAEAVGGKVAKPVEEKPPVYVSDKPVKARKKKKIGG